MEKSGVALDEIAYVGDDVIDLPVMRECGLAIAVGDARERVKAEAHYVTPNRGGHGAGARCGRVYSRSPGRARQVHRCVYRRGQSDFAVDGYWQGRGSEVERS
jgi:hypothetical protein